jgi:hypothetical protein
MKKLLLVFIAFAVFIPVTVHAFSFLDIFSLGKKIIRQEVKSKQAVTKAVAAPEEFSIAKADRKYQNWEKAFSKKDISLVIDDSQNLYFTEAEINYLIARSLASSSAAAARDVQVSFVSGAVKMSGYSLAKNLSGQFSLEAKAAEIDGRVGLKIVRARYRNFYFPALVAQNLLAVRLKDAINFLYSDQNRQKPSLMIGNGFIEINYNK